MLAQLAPTLGVMKFEIEPLSFENWRRLAWIGIDWLHDAGGFAMVGLVLWILNGMRSPIYEVLPDGRKRNRLVGPWFIWMGAIALCVYLVAGGLMYLVSTEHPSTQRSLFLGRMMTPKTKFLVVVLALAGLTAIVGFGGPFLRDFFYMRWGRIYALAKLSFKEAVRRRVVWVFLSILVLYLFPARWFFQEKPEDELKSIIGVTTRGLNVLLISVGLLLAAFSIPSDIKNLTIHTIITKPVERIEILLGRFLGYLGLVTVALVLMTAIGLLLINTGNVSEEAESESMKARVARYGNLEFAKFANRRAVSSEDFKGIDVGREDTYRQYIAGTSPHRAIWNFSTLPDEDRKKDFIPLEFAFDVYRTTKGEEGTGVQVSFDLYTHNWDPSKEEEYNQATKGFGNARPGEANWGKLNELAEQYGRFTWRGQQIYDYHTVAIPVPRALFTNAAKGTPKRDGPIQGTVATDTARRLQVQVRCETPSQFVGAAKHDLYFLESEGTFSINYFKGAIGLWYRLVIALAIAIALSTYLSGVLSFLTAMFLFVAGFFLDFIKQLAFGVNEGGGPLESLARLIQNSTPTAELERTPLTKTFQWVDGIYRWGLRRIMNVIPDVDQYGFTDYVAQGFSIGPDFLLLNLLTLLGYVLPWLVVAYYLLKAREIAA